MNKLQQRLEGYWRLELFNAVLLPVVAILVPTVNGQSIGPIGISCLVPMSGLLIVGGCYWRAKFRQIKDRSNIDSTLYWLDRVRLPLLASLIVASLLCVADLFFHRFSVSTGDRWVAILATALAILEYINYYHRQLQHFDHAPDFLRLLRGRGFRKSQLRADLDRCAIKHVNRGNNRFNRSRGSRWF
ncbi:MAG: hypothetical protein U1A77_00150 [Pirellulales bacterium]